MDTGAPFTVLPHHVWQPFESEIRWIESAGPEPVMRIAGAKSRFQFGRVFLSAFDDLGNSMPPAWTLACCLDSASPTKTALLDLRSELLMNRRRLRHAGETPPLWWLEDS